DADGGADEAQSTVVRVRKPRNAEDEITSLHGSTRLEAKKQRRREGREAGRRRAPIISEAEFLARRESVDRKRVIRQREDLTQIAVLEDKVLVEHYVARESQTSLIGNVYLGRVQNVLPSMEAAFIDIGKGRNAVLYAGEVDWALRGDSNQPRRIENALKPGQTVLVQVTKDPVGHKGARLTSQISLPGRYLVYVPGGGTSGISRKLPDTERNRLKNVLKDLVPDDAGVIIRTAAEGASEEELTRDIARLTARWDDIDKKSKNGQAPQLLYGEPDTTIKVVRDLFTEDFGKLVISGDDAWDMVEGYVRHVAPDLEDRLHRYSGDDPGSDLFSDYRIDEQIAKALERKVWLPSGGSLVIDRTEAMTVVDVNTGKFTGAGGNLEQTVTKNNLEAAEEIVRQLRLRDIGGIIVIDFIDMVLEDNRDLVLRRLVECLGRDRTRHQVAEVTSLGLVQMTRKRISTGLLEAFSENCEHCNGRGVVIKPEPVVEDRASSNGSASRSGRGDSDAAKSDTSESKPKRRSSGTKGKGNSTKEPVATEQPAAPASVPAALTPAGAHP
ncbi:MAG TPA: Rne/Rng family ribonuclease, partial [Pseudonocardiaceae bacterium]|nr:Rne/Rng family ribonuclease [Pseudonocardiaceae bacterium]